MGTQQAANPWTSPEDRAAAREAKRQAVLSTAVGFFNSRGFHSTSLDDVAAALNVTKPTIYHYFTSKEEILFECVRLGLETVRDAAEASRASGGSGLDRLRLLMREYALVMTQGFGMCVSLTSDDQMGLEARVRFRALKRDIHEILRAVIEEGMADGSIARGDSQIVASTVAGALNWIARWYDPEGPSSPEEIADGVVGTLTRGLAARAQGVIE